MDSAIHHLLWSLWTELGVPGTTRRHQTWAIDPEPLIVHTPALTRDEPRLLGLAFDWCRTNARWLSKTRLKAIANAAPKPTTEAFAAFSSDLAAISAIRWAPRRGTLGLTPDRDAVHVRLDRPAAARFRLRAITGISTRAEVIATLLGHTDGATAASLRPAGVSRPNTNRDLAELLEGGMTAAIGGERGRRHRLVRTEHWVALLQARGVEWRDLDPLLTLVSTVDALRRRDIHKPSTRVAVPVIRDGLVTLAAQARVPPPPRVVDVQDPIAALADWCERAIGDPVA